MKENLNLGNVPKIIVKPSVFEDCQQFYLWEKEKVVTEFFSIPDNQSYEEVLRDFFVSREDPTKEQYTIFDEASRKMIGRLYLSDISRRVDCFQIFRIYIGDLSMRNKGYGRAILLWTLDRAFNKDSFHRVFLDYYLGNKGAAHLYEKLGFQHEGVARGACKKMRQYHDVAVMAMTRDDYQALYKG